MVNGCLPVHHSLPIRWKKAQCFSKNTYGFSLYPGRSYPIMYIPIQYRISVCNIIGYSRQIHEDRPLIGVHPIWTT